MESSGQCRWATEQEVPVDPGGQAVLVGESGLVGLECRNGYVYFLKIKDGRRKMENANKTILKMVFLIVQVGVTAAVRAMGHFIMAMFKKVVNLF